MKKPAFRSIVSVLILACMLISLLGGCASTTDPSGTASSSGAEQSSAPEASPSDTHTVIDSYGRAVEVPNEIDAIILPSSYPVYLSYVTVYGMQDKVVNGMPESFSRDVWYFAVQVAPQIDEAPVVTDGEDNMNAEAAMALTPDVIICTDQDEAESLAEKGLCAVAIKLTDYDAFRDIFRILGEVFQMEDRTAEYLDYLDSMLSFVSDTIGEIDDADRARVLYFNAASMWRPNTVCEWWIPAAGGISSTAEQAEVSRVEMDMEAVYNANPDVIIEMVKSNLDIYNGVDWQTVQAVQDGRIYTTPVGITAWATGPLSSP